MAGHLTKSVSELDRTDELPVLSDEAIFKFELLDAESSSDKSDPLESSLDSLRHALDQAEQRWSALEGKLQNQDCAIAELKESLAHPIEVDGQPATTPEKDTNRTPPTVTETNEPEEIPGSDSALLERVASLESYIAGRADRWQEMEQELITKTRCLTELETELEQRVARELRLEEQLHHERERSNELRNKLRRLNRRLEESELGTVDPDLDATRELVGQVIDATPIRFLKDNEQREAEVAVETLPKLICLTSDGAKPYVIHKAAITIGRGSECDIQIVTDFVSRRHATIRRENADAIIEDKSSTNGVFVNAERVSRHILNDGDEIMIGESRFQFLGGDSSD